MASQTSEKEIETIRFFIKCDSHSKQDNELKSCFKIKENQISITFPLVVCFVTILTLKER